MNRNAFLTMVMLGKALALSKVIKNPKIILVNDRIDTSRRGRLTVTYTHGLMGLPDELTELVCSVAARMGGMPAELQAGVQSQGAGPFQQTYGWDSYKAASGLTEGEKQVLARYWPRLPRTITLGSPAG